MRQRCFSRPIWGLLAAVAAFHLLSEIEGIVPALESSHAIAWLVRSASLVPGKLAIVNLSGRGDKDLGIVEGR